MKLILSALLILTVWVTMSSCATSQYPSVPAYNRYSVEDILAMAREGQSPDEIIGKLDRAHAFYPLKAHELIQLHDQGVPLAVLDYMQETYLRTVRREERFQLPGRFSAPY